MEKSIELLKSKDIKLTQQRIEVCKLLLEEKKHLTAEEIYNQVRGKIPAVSLATIYAVLDLFKKKGIVSELKIKPDRACYELRGSLHHHFLCKECGMIFDVEVKPCRVLEEKTIEGHSVEDLKGYFFGVCRNCKQRAKG